jgi:hypothetical protein
MERDSIPRDAGSFHLALTAASNAQKHATVVEIYERFAKVLSRYDGGRFI